MPRHYVAVFLLVSAWTFSFDEEKLPDPLIFFGNQAALRINSSRWVSAQSHKALQNKKYLKALDGYAYLYRNGDVWHEKRIYRLIEKEGLSPLLDLLTPTKPNSKMKPSTGTSAEEKAHFLDFLRYTRSFLKSPSFSYGGSNPYVMAFMTIVNPAVPSAKGGFLHLNDPYGVYALLQTQIGRAHV